MYVHAPIIAGLAIMGVVVPWLLRLVTARLYVVSDMSHTGKYMLSFPFIYVFCSQILSCAIGNRILFSNKILFEVYRMLHRISSRQMKSETFETNKCPSVVQWPWQLLYRTHLYQITAWTNYVFVPVVKRSVWHFSTWSKRYPNKIDNSYSNPNYLVNMFVNHSLKCLRWVTIKWRSIKAIFQLLSLLRATLSLSNIYAV